MHVNDQPVAVPTLEEHLPEATPESQGIPSAAIARFVEAAERQIDALHSMVLVRHGRTVARGWWYPYQQDEPHELYSLSKSFTATAIGLAATEGRMSVDDPVTSFFPDLLPDQVGPNLATMRVSHLLSMNTGHAADITDAMVAAPDGNWARQFLAQPVEYEPGTHFAYNSAASYLLAAIVSRVTGGTLLEYLHPRLLQPLGIADATWRTCPFGIEAGGWGLSLRTCEVARFGELYLREGRWHDRQLLPAEWVRAASAHQADNSAHADASAPDWRRGYGFQFWRSKHGFRGDGAFGQYCLVLPKQDAVLALTGGTAVMQEVLDLVWEHLVPAMADQPLPADFSAEARLRHRLAGLRLPPVTGRQQVPTAARISGLTFRVGPAQPAPPVPTGFGHVPAIQELRFDFRADGSRVTVTTEHGTDEVPCGGGRWCLGTLTGPKDTVIPVAASGAWTDGDTYVIRLCRYRTPFVTTLTCRFHDDRLTVDGADNVGFEPVARFTVEAVS